MQEKIRIIYCLSVIFITCDNFVKSSFNIVCLKWYIILSQAYVFELEDEYAESDIPTTLIRSKADCPGMEVSVYFY